MRIYVLRITVAGMSLVEQPCSHTTLVAVREDGYERGEHRNEALRRAAAVGVLPPYRFVREYRVASTGLHGEDRGQRSRRS